MIKLDKPFLSSCAYMMILGPCPKGMHVMPYMYLKIKAQWGSTLHESK
jgi:hypothetical protein